MAKIGFNKLGLKKRTDVAEFIVNEEKVEVLQYLPNQEKAIIANQAVKGAMIDGIVHDILLDAFLHFLIVKHYTNISFTQKQVENLMDTFDLLEGNGVIEKVLELIPADEYDALYNSTKNMAIKNETFTGSITQGMGGVALANQLVSAQVASVNQ